MAGPHPRKGTWPAVTRLVQVGGLRLRLYLLYDDDEECARRLESFRRSWWSGLGGVLRGLDECLLDLDDAPSLLGERVGKEEAGHYIGALRAAANEIGLGRIPAEGKPNSLRIGYLPSGLAQAHAYLVRLDRAFAAAGAASSPASSREAMPRPTFVELASFGASVPDVDGTLADHTSWDPHIETLADARRRLKRDTEMTEAEIEAGLRGIMRVGAYRLPDTSARLERDATWVWWRIRYRWTYRRIAEEWLRTNPEPDWDLVPADPLVPGARPNPVALVQLAIERYAKKANVDVKTGQGRLSKRN